MQVQCVQCGNFTLRKDKHLAEHGFGVCLLDTSKSRVPSDPVPRRSMSANRDCKSFDRAEPGAAEKRIAWHASMFAELKAAVLAGDVEYMEELKFKQYQRNRR